MTGLKGTFLLKFGLERTSGQTGDGQMDGKADPAGQKRFHSHVYKTLTCTKTRWCICETVIILSFQLD